MATAIVYREVKAPNQGSAVAKKAPEPENTVLYLRLPPDLRESLEKFIADQRLKPKRQEVGILALTEFLEREGYWEAPK